MAIESQTAKRAYGLDRKLPYTKTRNHINHRKGMSTTMIKRAPLTFKTNPVTPERSNDKATSLPANAKTNKRTNDKKPSYRKGRKFVAAHVPEEAAKQFRLLAIQKDQDVQELLVEAINDLFAKNGLSRIA
jgi:hypothetical protein